MSNTRRSFLHSATAIAAGVSGAATLTAQTPQQTGVQGAGRQPRPATPPQPASEIQVPKMKFGDVEISRLVCGCNPFYGFAHYNDILGTIMKEYYTQERVCDVLTGPRTR